MSLQVGSQHTDSGPSQTVETVGAVGAPVELSGPAGRCCEEPQTGPVPPDAL